MTLFALLVLWGCGGQDDAAPAPDAESPTTDADIPTREVTAPIEAATFESFRLSVADLDVYRQGMAFENARLRAAAAETGDARMEAYIAALPEQSEPAAAASLNVSVDHYRAVKQAVSDVIGRFDLEAVLQSTQASAAAEGDAPPIDENIASVQAELDDPYAGLDAAVAEAFEARRAELSRLRADNIGLLMNTGG
jgi:hypothetical protein